jgi:hypothetical protein
MHEEFSSSRMAEDIVIAGKKRWLQNEEIFALLIMAREFSIPAQNSAPGVREGLPTR